MIRVAEYTFALVFVAPIFAAIAVYRRALDKSKYV
jgi:hypothetical protein